MSPSDDGPQDRYMLWVNLIGLALIGGLAGAFFWLYGADLVSFLEWFGSDPTKPYR